MNQKSLSARLAMFAVAFIVMIVFAATGSPTASAQCNGPLCNGVQIDADPSNPCAAPITRIECGNGTLTVPLFSPYAPGATPVEPCQCAGLGGVVAIRVGATRVPINTTACIAVAPGCTLFYDVQIDNNNCIRVKITKC